MVSLWERQSLLHADVIIIGAGICGLSTAISLKEKRPELSIMVLEKSLIPKGASTRNAGFACFGSLSEIVSDRKNMDEPELLDLVRSRWDGLALLRKRLGDQKIDYLHKGGYELLFGDLSILDHLDSINELLYPVFEQKVFSVQNHKISEFGLGKTSGLIFNELEAQIDTGKMFNSLYDLALRNGIRILTGANILEISEKQVVAESYTFSASAVVLTTNAFTNDLIKADLKPGRGMVLVVNPESLPFEGIFHYEEGYYYFRDYYGKVIFGGGRNLDLKTEETTGFDINQRIYDKLISDLDQIILPGVEYKVEHQWTGIMAFGQTKAPIIERNNENIFMGVRLGGMGVALGSKVGDDLSKLVLETVF